MVKKKKVKRNKRQHIRKITRDNHHILYQKNKWSIGYCQTLRNFWYCQIILPIDVHHSIHNRVSHIPVPNGVDAKFAYEQLKLLEKQGALHETDSLEKRIRLLAFLFDCASQKTADALRRQLV